jgi:hypothetical protein
VIQEIVDRPGWSSGNALVVLVTGTGKRVATSFNGDPAGAPLLHVVYTGGPPNSPPLAGDDSASTDEDTTVTIDVAANDSDPDGNLDRTSANVACAGCTTPANGGLANNGDGTFDYTPTSGFYGSDNFTYEICDAFGACDTASVSIAVHPYTLLTVEVRVAANSDDAEENGAGHVSLTSGDLELVFDKDEQTVGIRFAGVAIPQGATIVTAYLQFQVDEPSSETATLTVQGQAHDDAVTFDNVTGNISTRARTAAAVTWEPAPWTAVGKAGPDQQTSNIAPVIQEVVDRPGWSSGNALAIIITGTGRRVAESFNGDKAGAPLLHVEYAAGN